MIAVGGDMVSAQVMTWHPTKDPKDSDPEAVVMQIVTTEATVLIRIRSARAFEEFLNAFTDHGREVWPEVFKR